jgi:hypothetical protein
MSSLTVFLGWTPLNTAALREWSPPVNPFEEINNLTWNRLYDVKTQYSSEKTMFNLIYDELKLDESRADVRMQNMVKENKSDVNAIKLYVSKYERLWK